MAKGFGGGLYEGLKASDEMKLKKRNSSMDELVKMAQLKEAGYDVQHNQPQGFFGRMFGSPTMTLTQNPNSNAVPTGFTRVGGKVVKDPTYIDAYKQARISNMGQSGNLTPGQKLLKTRDTNKMFDTVELNKVKEGQISSALEGAEAIPKGFFGKMRVNAAKTFPSIKGIVGVSDRNIQDAQEMKIALTMGTLAETAHTKGAISDQEMNLFKEAAANDDFNSPAVIPVLNKIKAYIGAENEGMFGAFQKNYGEDMRPYFGQGSAQKTEFNSPQEADASGLPKGTRVSVKGRPYEI